MSTHVRYVPFPRRYRFQTAEPFAIETSIVRPGEPGIGNAFVQLTSGGLLAIAAGYAWDGASGPIAQTPDVIRGSLVHDALYQLMREGLLPVMWRPVADELLREMCVTDGMPRWQADMVHAAVAKFGGRFADPEQPQPVLTAPVPLVLPSLADWIAP